LQRLEIDPGGWLIRLLERMGLAWDVVRIDLDRQSRKLMRVDEMAG
jgi:fatty-acid desaturase